MPVPVPVRVHVHVCARARARVRVRVRVCVCMVLCALCIVHACARLRHQLCALRLLDLDPSEYGGNGDGGGALDVVVVGEELLAALRQQREGVVRVEVLELQQAPGMHRAGMPGRHKVGRVGRHRGGNQGWVGLGDTLLQPGPRGVAGLH